MEQFKREEESGSSQLNSNNYNRFIILSKMIENKFCYNIDNRDIDILRAVIVRIGLERIDI